MIYDELKTRQAMLTDVLSLCNQKLKNSPDGSLRAAKNGKSIQYYLKKEGSGPNGIYIKKKKGKK